MRKLLSWLNNRFPEQLTVTKEDYTQLREEVAQLNQYAQAIGELHKRLEAAERNLTILSAAQGFSSPTGKGFGKLER